MALSKTRLQAVDLDDIERQIREIAPRRNDDRLAELAKLVGLNLGGGRVRAIPATPISPSDRDQENGQAADAESAQDFGGSVEQASDDAEGRGPDQPDAPAPRALERSQRRSRALGL